MNTVRFWFPCSTEPTMPGLSQHFYTMAANNAWANHRLLQACRELTDAEFAAPRVSFFPSIKATYNHILTVDWYYLEMLERSHAGLPPHEEPARFFQPEQPFASCAPLAAAQREADLRLIAYCQSLTDEHMDEAVLLPRRAGLLRDRVRRILAHLFQHQVHHRGQVHAMLAGTHAKPPQLDEFYCTAEDTLRAGDFAALGFTEEDVWGPRAVAP